MPRRTRAGLATLALALLLLPAAQAHWQVRHADMPTPRTLHGDVISFVNGTATWRVVTPSLRVIEAEGPSLALPPGIPVDGTWTVRAQPLACDEGDHGIAWRIHRYARLAPVPLCGDTVWMFNWYPYAYPSLPDVPFGTILLYGPDVLLGDVREGQEATFYQNATPYYNVEEFDGANPDMEALGTNSHPLSERSAPSRDDDGDGAPNRGDEDHWVGAWLAPWLVAHGFPAPPGMPRADLLAEDGEREAARALPDLGALLGEDAAYATSDTRGEGPAQTPQGAVEVLTFTLRDHRTWQTANPLTLGVSLRRTLADVLLDVPARDGAPAFDVDLAATRALLPAGWSVALWRDSHGTRVLFQTDNDHAVGPEESVALRLAARATSAVGPSTWDVTMLFGPSAAERRFAFLQAEVVAP